MVAITEADIDNYSGMYLQRQHSSQAAHCMPIFPHADRSGTIDLGYAVETTTPFQSPWRVLMIGDEPGKLIESNIVLNLEYAVDMAS